MKKLFTMLLVLAVGSQAYGQGDARTRGSSGGNQSTTTAQANKRKVSGRVIDANGEPLIGATVSVLNKTTGTVLVGGFTDANGEFDLSVDDQPNLVLRMNYVGYKIQEVSVDQSSQGLNIEMSEDVLKLDEVVVVGYGSQSRASVTGSVSRVTATDIRDVPQASINQMLQGRAAGVFVSQNSGTPGVGVSVRIRGLSSISASNEPLYVIDGVPVTTGDFSQLGFGGQSVNALSDLNPNDIESFEVLKDAGSAAIYGSRAANGVILITTKRGAAKKTQVNVGVYTGFQSYWRKPGFLNSTDYLTIFREGLTNDGYFAGGETLDDVVSFYYGGLPWGIADPGNGTSGHSYNYNDTDWIGVVSKNNAPISQYDFNVSGGDEKTRFYLGGSWFDQFGVIIGSRFNRLSGRLNLDHSINSKVAISLSTQLSRSLNDRMVSDNTLNGPFANALAASPLWPVFFANNYTRPNFFYTSPLAEAQENDDFATNNRILSNVTVRYTPITGLTFTGRLGLDYLSTDERRYTPSFYPGSAGLAQGGTGTSTNAQATKWLIELFAEYRKTFAENHNVKVIGGHSRERNDIGSSFVSGFGFAGDQFRYLASASVINAGSNTFTQWGIMSWFARAEYDYKGKYLLGMNVRADAGSRFGDNNKWGTFPGLSVGWRLSEEDFVKNLDIFSELKLRASWGINGNQELGGNFAYRNLSGPAIYLDLPGIAPTQLGDPNLKWERTTQIDLGADVGVLKGRIYLSVDWYRKTTNDLLFNRPINTQTGFGGYATNIGSMENTGMDFTLSGSIIEKPGDNFRWKADLNISFYRNKILSLYQGQDALYGFGGNSLILREGNPIGSFYGWVSDGVYSRTSDIPAEKIADGVRAGDINFRDISGDGIVRDNDLGIIGNPHPDWFGGLNNTLSYKGIELTAFFQFSVGNDIWDASGNFTQRMMAEFFDDNQRDIVLGRWRQEGDVTDVPRASIDDLNNNRRSNSTRFISDGSYLRLKNLILAYNLPKAWLDKVKLRSVRVYAQAQNLITWTKYKGFDPEVNFAGNSNTTIGVDFYTVPQLRTITFGINVGF